MSIEDSTGSGAEEALLGRVVAGKYRIDRLLGSGGMGAVFQATNLSIEKRVALKFLKRDAVRDPGATERFQREALAASLVESSHIVQIFDSGTSEEGLPFLVMELLTGEDLRARLSREGRLPVQIAATVGAQVLRALVRAHAAGIVHRDLKPDNVFLCERDDGSLHVKIVDFGVSKLSGGAKLDTLTRRGTVLGTAFYMSPEQAQAFSDVDGRTDLFGLGAILYECLAARPPHVAPTYEAVLIAICTKQPEDICLLAPHVPRSLADVIHRALATERSQRYASAQAMLDALNAALPTSPLPRSASAPLRSAENARDTANGEPAAFARTSRAPSLHRSHPTRTAITAGIFVLAGFAVATWWAGSRPNRTAPAGDSSGSPKTAVSAVPVAAPPPADTGAPVAASAPASASARPTPLNAAAATKRSSRIQGRTAPRSDTRQGVGQGLELSTREP